MPPPDEDLTRLFDEARGDLPSEAFLERFQMRMARARRARLILQLCPLVLLAAVAAIVAPYAARGSLVVIEHAVRWIPDLGLAMTSPIGWVCSLALGVWVLRRSHVFER
jgi:hypothetical protein